MAEPQQPTDEQLTQAKAAADAEIAKWEGDFKEEDLAVPYKREENTETDKEKEQKDAVDTETDKTSNETGEESEESAESVEQFNEPAPVVTVKDPGEYKAGDYSFEVTLADGKTHKVATAEEAETIAADPDNFETPKQLMDFMNKQQAMRNKLDKEYEKWESDKQTFTQQLELETQRREQIDGFVGEFNYLVGKGLIPAVAKEYLDADWSDPEIAKQPGVKEQQALLNYMVKENATRQKAGVKPITSIVDAFNAWQLDTNHKREIADVKKAEEDQKAAGQARKVAGSRVAGVSASQQAPYIPQGIAVGNPNVLRRGAAQWDD